MSTHYYYQRQNKKRLRNFLSDLYDVGKTKATGHLGIKEIETIGNSSEKEMIQFAKEHNLMYYVKDNIITFYHKQMLEELLIKYSKILKDAGIPITPKRYLHYIETQLVKFEIFPQAFVAVAKTFNDPKFLRVDPFNKRQCIERLCKIWDVKRLKDI